MMPKKKKKTKKVKSSSLKKSKKTDKHPLEEEGINLREISERFWNSESGKAILADANGEPLGTVVSVLDEAKKVQTWQQLENFVELYMPGLDPTNAAIKLFEYARDNWMVVKILSDPEHVGSIATLLSEIDNVPGGAVKIYNGHINKENEDVLETFCIETGYKKPPTAKTFQNDITYIKNHWGIKRKGNYKKALYRNSGDKEFSIHNKPKNLK